MTLCIQKHLILIGLAFTITISTAADDITTQNDDIISGILHRLDYLETRDKLHKDTAVQQQQTVVDLQKQLDEQKLALQEKDLIIKQQQQQIKKLQQPENPDRLKRFESENPVAFYAKISSVLTHVNRSQTIIFDQSITNVGNRYDNYTGVFMAPVPGIYLFSLTLMTEYNTDTHVGIFVNSHMKTYMKLYGSEHLFDTMSQTAVYVLRQGDRVTVKHLEDDKSIYHDYSYFSGVLIEQDLGQMAIIG